MNQRLGNVPMTEISIAVAHAHREIETTMRYLVRSRSSSPLNEAEFRTVRSLLDRLDEARRGN